MPRGRRDAAPLFFGAEQRTAPRGDHDQIPRDRRAARRRVTSTIQVVRHPDARAFLARAERWLEASEMENGMALASARNARYEEWRYEKPVYWATIEDGGRILGCAFRTPPHRLGVTALNNTAIAATIVNVGQVYRTLSGVSGPEPTVSVLAEAWCRTRGTTAVVRSRHRLYSLRVLVPPTQPPRGALRLATEADAALVRSWGEAFTKEAGVEGVDVSLFDQLVKARKAYVWDDEQPRCLAASIRQTSRASAIGVLFTPHELRGRGYGTATVAALSALLFAGGSSGCYLFADPDNTAVSRIAGGIGYQKIQDQADVDFR